ncbi:cytochrome c oxidase assembly protein [Paenibacillus sp. BSR1-1]|uniref:cytochrome c oxidase assembly protein n=1 Tax=Paenibacillus sp. BSR1-1 TaxID=3020845 RepID=UPI0025B03817|nr:cytochrome c oxidase assembly protein [Paenibacillus sp. BSR1-1]MDN3019119.1 cytochrome c oxidase assembly protein [Paenibacillus sp. BSR1-1]
MHNEHVYHGNGIAYELILLIAFLLVFVVYILASFISNRHYKRWPLSRTIFWVVGILCLAVTVVGSLAEQAHIDFSAHMLGHLLLGMAAPLLIVLSAPMTLVMRNLHVKRARQLSKFLKSYPIRILSDPIFASLFNVGGLWILYTTDLYSAMHHNIVLYFFIHVHVFLAGYLFTAAFISIDPTPHRTNFIYRTIVLFFSFANHGILSKYIYAHPPLGVAKAQAEMGSMLMYYGGDVIDIVLIYILCLQWYRFKRPVGPWLST